MSTRAKIFVAATTAIGALVLASALWHWQSTNLLRFSCYLLVAALASGLKVRLPGIDGTMSVNFLFILLGILELGFPQTLIIGCAASLVQCFWHAKQRPSPVKVAFNVGMMANAIGLSYYTYHRMAFMLGEGKPMALMFAALVYFVANTLPVSIIIALTEGKSYRKIWSECYFWSFPYYLVGAAVVGLVGYVNRHAGWQTTLLVLPIIFWVYRSYRQYLDRLENEKMRVEIEKRQVEIEKRHVEEVASLHVRTIEALALAIEAKDHTTHEHLHRVRTYAMEIGRELGLSEDELEALRAAALLHDIGKLAVPENIINKPGRLTPEEFEKMKIHPIVGSEILERVSFPYPVSPIVRSHHEKWDGSGYPDGLKEEAIPIGARIFAAVDCLDALASDRQYRNALSLDHAMEKVAALSGTSFDPRVVEILKRRYVELEGMVQAGQDTTNAPGLAQVHLERGLDLADGFDDPAVVSVSGG